VLATALAGACLPFLTVDDATFDRYQLPKELAVLLCAALLAGPLIRRMRFDLLDATAFAAVGLTLVSTLFARTPGIAERSLALTCATAVLFLSARRLSPEEQQLPWAACIAAVAAVAALALGESFGLVTGLSSQGRAPGSSLGQRNDVAHLCLLASPAAWAFAAISHGKRRVFALGAAVLFAAAIVQTRSRAAWVVAPAVLFLWLALEFRRARSWNVLAWVGIAAMLAVGASVATPARLDWRSRTPLADTLDRLTDTSKGSGKGRVVQAQASLPLLSEHPLFGFGPGHWMVEYPRARPPSDPTFFPDRMLPTGRFPNADALAFLVERGLLFSLVLLFALALAARAVWTSGKENALAPAAAATLLGAVGLSGLDAVLHLAPAATLVAITTGLAFPGEEDEAPSRALPAIALTLLLVVGAVRAGNRLEGLRLKSQERSGLEGLEAAIAWNPSDYEARLRLSEALVLDQQCERARPHLVWLGEALPHHPFAQRLRSACGVR
jgi:O-antigen ligase